MGATIHAGDIRQLTVKGRELAVKGESKCEIMLSGFKNKVEPAGNGTALRSQSRTLGGFSGLEVIIDDAKGDLEYLQGIANAGDPVSVNLTLASNKTYTGSLQITSDLKKDAAAGTCSLDMTGEKFEQI